MGSKDHATRRVEGLKVTYIAGFGPLYYDPTGTDAEGRPVVAIRTDSISIGGIDVGQELLASGEAISSHNIHVIHRRVQSATDFY